MSAVQWIDARSVEEAVALLSAPGAQGTTFAKAGGLDLLDLMKEGIVAPARIVNLHRIDALRGVSFAESAGLRLGALTTLAEIANDASLRRHPAGSQPLAGEPGHIRLDHVERGRRGRRGIERVPSLREQALQMLALAR